MSAKRIVVVRNLILLLLTATICILAYILYDLYSTKQKLAATFISKPLQSITIELDGFFQPMRNILSTAMSHGSLGKFRMADTASVNSYFTPFLRENGQISSMGVADKYGYEHDLIKMPEQWQTRTIHYGSDSLAHWARLIIPTLEADSVWSTNVLNDPRLRPWHQGAMEDEGLIYWTGPYTFNTDRGVGMTISSTYQDWSAPDSLAILALDLTLDDLSVFTSGIKISENGMGLVLTDQYELVTKPDSAISQECYEQAIEMLNSRKGQENEWAPFKFKVHKEFWWAEFRKLMIDDRHYVIIGVLVLEKDMMAHVYRSENVTFAGMGVTFFFILVLIWTQREVTNSNKLLVISNLKVKEQSELANKKNIDLLDSILYAKRLQDAMLPPSVAVKEFLRDSFIMYQPKDVVSGDFYWVSNQNGTTYFSVADCTGHGVPGAFMSILGMSLLNSAIANDKLQGPAHLLTIVRKLMIARLESDRGKTKDGMDMALCSFNMETGVLKFAGALSDLFVVRLKGHALAMEITSPQGNIRIEPREESDTHQLFIIKGDRTPIGYTDMNTLDEFSEYALTLLPDDIIYLTSDGIADQFGGEYGKKFGQHRFRKLLMDLQSVAIKDQESEIRSTIENWKKDELQVDDICIMGARLMG